jgi:hypothetical protein
MKMRVIKLLGVSSVLLAASVASVAKAAAIQFATFDAINADAPLSWTNVGGTSGVLSVVNAPIQFTFTNQSGLPSTFNAVLNISSQGPSATVPAIPGFVDAQVLDQQVVLTVTNPAVPAGQPGNDLLTAVFSQAYLYGVDGSLGGAIADQSPTVAYYSDYLAFNNVGGNAFTLGLETLSAPISVGPGGFLNSFVSNLDGQFSAPSLGSIPEPSSLGLLGVAGLALVRRRTAR